MRPDEVRDEGLRELGANERLRLILQQAGGQRAAAEKLLEAYKAELKKKRREVALQCHPDRTAGDPKDVQEEKAARFKRITRAVDYVLGLRLRTGPVELPQRAPQGPVVVVVMRGFGATTSTTSTTSTVTGNFGTWSVPW